VSLFTNQDYKALLKRSDADFQMFINPKIPNYEKVYNDVSILVTFMMYSMKKVFQKKSFGIDIGDTQSSKALLKSYKEVLPDCDDISVANRSDFIIFPTTTTVKRDRGKGKEEEMIVLKEVPELLTHIPRIPKSPFFISRNTAIRFRRKDDTYNSFDLLRMKYNMKVQVGDAPISVPSEVIDVGIPKKDDNTISTLIKGASKWLVKYTYTTPQVTFQFWAPSLNYMIKDVDEVLFKQNEYPWNDKKIAKRLQRYFLGLLVHSIVSSQDPIDNLISYKNEMKRLIKFLTCFNTGTECEIYGEENVTSILHNKYRKIFAKINKIADVHERANQIREFKAFNTSIIHICNDLSKQVSHLITIPERRLLHLKNKISKLHSTEILG
jgi:hypothetical protein